MNRAVQLIQLSKVPHAYWSIASDYKSDIIFIMSLPYFRLYLYLLFVVSSFQWYSDLLITILPPLELSLISVSSSDSVCSPRPITMSQPQFQIHIHCLPQKNFFLNNWQSPISYRMMEICIIFFFAVRWHFSYLLGIKAMSFCHYLQYIDSTL